MSPQEVSKLENFGKIEKKKFGKKSFSSDTDTKIRPWFRFLILKPDYGHTLPKLGWAIATEHFIRSNFMDCSKYNSRIPGSTADNYCYFFELHKCCLVSGAYCEMHFCHGYRWLYQK